MLTNLYHDRQLYNTLIPLSHKSPAVGLRISRLSGSVELTLRYTTPDIHCRHRRHECDGGIIGLSDQCCVNFLVALELGVLHVPSSVKFSADRQPAK